MKVVEQMAQELLPGPLESCNAIFSFNTPSAVPGVYDLGCYN